MLFDCTPKPTGTTSHIEALMYVSKAIMHANDLDTNLLRPVDFMLHPEVHSDMTERGFDQNDWPELGNNF